MAMVAVFACYVWRCPYCPTVLKTFDEMSTSPGGAFKHLAEKHGGRMDAAWSGHERVHWAFTVRP